MRYLIYISVVLLSSCNECRNNDCTNNVTFKFRIVDQNENNLLLDSDGTYSFNSLKVEGIQTDEIIQLNYINRTNFIEVPLTIDQSGVIIRYLKTGEADTLELTDKSFTETDCCDPILEEYSILSGDDLLCRTCSNTVVAIEKIR